MSKFAFLSKCHGATLAALIGTAAIWWPASAAQNTRIPNFMEDATVGWLAAGTEYIPMETGPQPVKPDPAHPYIANGRPGQQPTLRVADIDNPILQPWVKE